MDELYEYFSSKHSLFLIRISNFRYYPLLFDKQNMYINMTSENGIAYEVIIIYSIGQYSYLFISFFDFGSPSCGDIQFTGHKCIWRLYGAGENDSNNIIYRRQEIHSQRLDPVFTLLLMVHTPVSGDGSRRRIGPVRLSAAAASDIQQHGPPHQARAFR